MEKRSFLAVVLLSAFMVFTVNSSAQEIKDLKSDDFPKFVITETPEKEPEISKPAKEDVIYGDSEFRLWVLDSLKEGVTFGIWESTPGKWKYTSPQWEYCRILSGKTVIVEGNGKSRTVKAGDSFLLKPGVSCTWEVIETTRKEFVSYDF